MLSILWFLIIGLVAGALARLIVPGKDPMGILGTLVLGVIGSFIGGFLGNLIAGDGVEVSPAGFIGSVVGAIIALLIYRAMRRNRTTV